MARERLFYLDLIRAVSVLFVIIFHFNIHLGLQKINGEMIFHFLPNLYLGRLGVSLFIIISGAALMYAYQEKLNIKNFFKKRFLSIFPIFWTAYVIALLYTFYMNKSINHSAENWTFILTIIGMDGYLSKLIPNFYLVGEWFLGFIILFYILFPLLRKWVIEKPKTLIVVTTIIYFISVQFDIRGYNVIGFPDIFSRMPEFLFGMFFIYYIKKVNLYKFFFAFFVMFLFYILNIEISLLYKVTILGICSFIVLVYIGQILSNEKIKSAVSFISKYSFPSIFANQLVMVYFMRNFNSLSITIYESYILFFSVYIIITLVAILVYKISNRLTTFFIK